MSRIVLADSKNFDAIPSARGLQGIVTDGPAGIAFMGRGWDKDHGGRDPWVRHHAEHYSAGLRACDDGVWILAWALPKTSHWTACAIDDARDGRRHWEITDVLTHNFGQGWPKNAETCLKPSSEHWILARNGAGAKLQIDACRVERGAREARAGRAWSEMQAGARNIERPEEETTSLGSWPTNALFSHCPECSARGTRVVQNTSGATRPAMGPALSRPGFTGNARGDREAVPFYSTAAGTETVPAFDCLAACDCGAVKLHPSGGAPPRCDCGAPCWWACPVAGLDEQSGAMGMHSAGTKAERGSLANNAPIGYGGSMMPVSFRHGDVERGSAASRFFPTFHYAAKCPTAERHAGCSALLWRPSETNLFGFDRIDRATYTALPDFVLDAKGKKVAARATGNVHPTVKPLDVGRWLWRLIVPKGARGGDLYAGSGSLVIAGWQEGIDVTGADISPEAVEIAQARLRHWRNEGVQEGLFAAPAAAATPGAP